MSVTDVFPAVATPGFKLSYHQFKQAHFALFLLAISLVLSVIVGTAKAAQSVARPEATGSTDPSTILPMSLGKPSACFDSSPNALNNGAYPQDLVVVGAANCEGVAPGVTDYLAHKWQNGSWSRVGLPVDRLAIAESVSDVPADEPRFTVTTLPDVSPGGGITGKAWVIGAGQTPFELPLLPGMNNIEKAVITADGNHIVGSNSKTATNPEVAVRWTRNGNDWLPPEEIGRWYAVAASADGSMVVGKGPDGPWVWTAKPGGGGDTVLLSSDPRSFVRDITQSGSMIVGYREDACPNKPPGCFYPIPVYWVKEGGGWVMHDLQALDGVDSEAKAVAIVDGQPIIVGYGYNKSPDGGILRPVAWIPGADGSFGEPVRLLAVGGYFDSWAEAVDINRNGLVLGWSDNKRYEPGGPIPSQVAVLWNLFNPFHINAGLNGAWYNPATSGQGFFISVFPGIGQVFLAWFTYDTERPPESVSANLGDPGQRWLTAFGAYDGNQALLDIELTQGGTFDSATPKPIHEPADGTMTLHFTSCNEGTITFDIPSIDQQGVIPIQRLAPDNIPTCEALDESLAISQETSSALGSRIEQASGSVPAANGFLVNAGLNDAWYSPATDGQGFFLDVLPDSHQAFLAWFTYDTGRPSDSVSANLGEPGHRWLTALGNYSGNQVELDIEVTKGGVFNSPDPAPTQGPDGTITLEFSGCNAGTVTYDIPSIGRQGVIPIERIALDNVPSCEAIQAQ